MTEPRPDTISASETEAGDGPPSVATGLAFFERAGGFAIPLVTTAFAFLVGGLVVLATGKDPLSVYSAIFNGTGLKWFFPWVHGAARATAASFLNLTLIYMTTLILTGLAVAFAFRCGLFNIGGQGQYIVGSLVAVQIGIWFGSVPKPLHIVIAIGLATIAGAAWAGIAGILRASVGAHEVITTIMLNWVALWIGSYLVGFGGPMQDKSFGGVNPNTPDIKSSAKLPVWWPHQIQGIHIGFFIALAALVVFWFVINRTTLGYEVRAVGYNAEAARYGGIRVARNYLIAMAISGAFAGLAGAIDLLGWEFHIDITDVQSPFSIAFIGIAVALLGRNSALGIFFSSLLFAALFTGTTTRTIDPSVFPPELATNLSRIIQGLVVLFVGADLLVIYLWRARRKLIRRTT